MGTAGTASASGGDSLEAQLGRYRALVLPGLLAALAGREPRRFLYDLIAAHVERMGKGLRPALCIATAEAFGGDARLAIPSATALEMLHNAFLVHDDIEDESESRRDRPTMFTEHGIPLAVNAGDAMQALALRMLKDNFRLLGPALAARVVDEFDHLLMQSLEGQAMELGWVRENNCAVTEEDYLLLVLKKTCWYSFIHPCRIGALIAVGAAADDDAGLAERMVAINRFGYLLGAAFQIQDDVLNLIGDRRKYGKEIGGDLWEGKRTLILAHAFRCAVAREAERLRTTLAKPRAARTPSDIDWIQELLRRHRSIEFARSAARQLAAAADVEATRAFARAANADAVGFIRALVRYVIEREV